MVVYTKERLDYLIFYLMREHFKKYKKLFSQKELYKFLALFEFRMLKKYGEVPIGLEYVATRNGPIPKNVGFTTNKIIFNEDYFSEVELEELEDIIRNFLIYDSKSIKAFKKTELNYYIDPIKEFDRDILNINNEELTSKEERYIVHLRMKLFK